MKTSTYFIDDEPLQILFFDNEENCGNNFFNSGRGTAWFDYDLHMIDGLAKMDDFLKPVKHNQRAVDLLFVSNTVWSDGGEQLVRQIRSSQHLAALPVYCVASCSHKLNANEAQCMNIDWRAATNCDHYAKLAAQPFQSNLEAGHPAYLHGILCGNNISGQVTKIINNMNQYWFCSDPI